MIAVVNYGLGNLQSIMNAFDALREPAELATNNETLKRADAIVIPGVGAFRDGIHNLEQMGIIPVLKDEVLTKKKPFFGVCLGMQLIAQKSFEHGEYDGLGWIDFTVRKISPTGEVVRIPHMGWNELQIKQPESALFQGVTEPATVYFVHSYYLDPNSPEAASSITSTCHHGQEITATVEQGNIFGAQFHPEKSQNTGLAILKNFISVVHSSHA